MAISFVAGAQASGTTVSIPAHQVGDFILAWTFRSGSNTAPSTPSGLGWNIVGAADGTSANNSAGYALAWKIASTTSESFGTWGSATQCEVAVYRGTDQTSPIGATATATAISTDVTYPALTSGASGSWIAAAAAHRTSTIVNTAPTGFVNRVNRGSGTAALAIHDTDGPASSSASNTQTGSNSSGWRTAVFELKPAATTGDATANGQTFGTTTSLTPGAASGTSGSVAAGVILSAVVLLFSGTATGQRSPTAGGQTLNATTILVPGAASSGQPGTANGSAVSLTASLLRGTATGQRSEVAAGVTFVVTAGLQTGSAGAIGPTSPDRIVFVPHEKRLALVVPDGVSRVLSIEPERRLIAVPAESRTVKA